MAEIYVVKSGNNVDQIAQEYGVSVESIIYTNQLIYPYELAVGQALLIMQGAEEERQIKWCNGFAYTFISPWVLQQTLPYLTELTVFSYGFTEDGELIPPQLDDEWMVNAALATQTVPVLTLTPLGPDGLFNNQLIHSMVNSEAAKEQLVDQLLNTMMKKGYQGLDIDFEYILAEDRDAFTAFVEYTAGRMRENGYRISVDLAPKTSAEQKGLLYEGKDYRALGEIVDSVLLMTYEWGYKYGPNMAVAPLNKVRQVVEYAVTEIDPGKIRLGMANYGYDWPLPFEQGITAATTIGNVEAVRIAIEYGVEIKFDETAQSPYFNYVTEQGISHEVWFEDVRSYSKKFDLIREFGLEGMGYWNLMRYFRANWELVESQFVVKI